MKLFLLKRLLSAFLLMWLMSIIIFVLFINSTDGLDRVFVIDSSSPFEIARQRSLLEIDRSPAEQYFIWLGQVMQGNFGVSVSSDGPGFPIDVLLIPKIKASLILTVTAVLFAVLMGLILGIISAMRPHSKIATLINIFVITGVSIPDFALGILLIVIFAVKLHLLPPSGMQGFLDDPTFFELIIDRGRHLILPVITLSFAYIATFTEHVRISLLEVMNEDYIRTARSKGLTELRILLKHSLRNSIIPIMATLFSSIPFFLGGIVVVEYLFSYPGLGLYLFQNLTHFHGDFYIGLIIIGMASFVALMASFLADFLYAIIDPRIKSPLHKQSNSGGFFAKFTLFILLGILLITAYYSFYHNLIEFDFNLRLLMYVPLGVLLFLSWPQYRKQEQRITKKSINSDGKTVVNYASPRYCWQTIKKLSQPKTVIGFVLLLLIVLGSFYPQYLGYQDTSSLPIDFTKRLDPPSFENILGTNNRGQDMLLFILVLTQDTLAVVFFATLIGIIGGLILGLLTGFLKGIIDKLILGLFDLISSVPSYFLVLLIMNMVSPTITNVVIITSIFGVIELTRVCRARVLEVGEFQFLEAAHAVGNTNLQILIKHLLRNVLPLIWGQGIILFGKNMLLLSSLGYLRVLPFLSWGSVAGEAVRRSLYSWWTSVFPIMFIFITVMAVNLLGKGVLKVIDPFAEKQ